MADGVSFKIEGLDDLQGKLRLLNVETGTKGGWFALGKAADVVVLSAKEGALKIDDPKTAENIAKNIVKKRASRGSLGDGVLMWRVGVLGGARSKGREAKRARARRASAGIASLEQLGEIAGKGKDNPGGDTWYWRFIEFGTEKTRAKPFMRPALESNIDKATRTFVDHYNSAVDRAIKRGSRAWKNLPKRVR